MNEQMTQRCDQLFKMGLMFNGQSYVGTKDNNNDVNFHYTEIQCDSDEEWNKKVENAKAELTRRGIEFED